jgi:hypothetical protein
MALGLADYKKRKAEEEARREEAGKPKVNRFTLKKDGDSAVVRFAQELDPDASGYDDGLGIGFIQLEHDARGVDNKKGWLNRANCSIESQGACWPCEKANDYDVEWDSRKGWKQKEKFYINLIAGEAREEKVQVGKNERSRFYTTDVDRKTGDGVVTLLEQSPHNGVYNALVDYFLEEEVSEGTILNKYFKITRKGNEFNDTSYGITVLKEIPEDAKPLSEFELYNVEDDILTEVPYAQQESFYHKGLDLSSSEEEEEQPKVEKARATDDTW